MTIAWEPVSEGAPVHAHKVLCMRCTYFRAMLTGEMIESRAREVVLNDVRHPIFLALLEVRHSSQCHHHHPILLAPRPARGR